MRHLILIFAVMAVLLSTATSHAQTRDTLDRKNFREKLFTLKKEKLMEKMNLDEVTADKVFGVVRETMEQIGEYNKQKRLTYQYIEQNPDASDIDAKINELLDFDVKIANAKKDQYDKLKEFLTPSQIAKAYLFNRNFDKELKKKLKDFKKEGKRDKKKRK